MPVLTPSAGGGNFIKTHIPPGTYNSRVLSIVPFEMNDTDNPGQKVQRLRWSFEVMSKKTQEVKVIEGITSFAWGPGVPGMTVPKAWRWASTIMKDTPTEIFDTDELVGFECKIKVIDRKDKKTGDPISSVDDVVPPEGEF